MPESFESKSFEEEGEQQENSELSPEEKSEKLDNMRSELRGELDSLKEELDSIEGERTDHERKELIDLYNEVQETIDKIDSIDDSVDIKEIDELNENYEKTIDRVRSQVGSNLKALKNQLKDSSGNINPERQKQAANEGRKKSVKKVVSDLEELAGGSENSEKKGMIGKIISYLAKKAKE